MESEKNAIAGNVVTQIIGRVFVLAMALVTVKLISNYSGTEGTGYYNTIITYLTFFITIADFGLFSIGVREIAKNPDKKKQLFYNIFTVRLISAALVTLIAILIARLTHYPEIIKNGVIAASGLLFINLVGSIFDLIFQTRLEMSKVATAEVIGKLVSLIALALIVAFRLEFIWIVATVSLSSIVGIIVKFLLATKDEIPKLAFDAEISKKIVSLALPFGMIFILNNFYFKVDTLILFYFKGASDVGIYAVAYRVLETTMFAASYLAYSLKPLLSANIESDKNKAASATGRGLTFLFSIALAICVFCIPFSREIIIFLSNADFITGAPVIVILSFTSIFIYLNCLLNEVLIAKDSRKYLLGMTSLILVINIAANIILIPKYSFYAAAYITLASEILIFILASTKARTILPLKFDFGRMSKLIFSAVLSIVLGVILRNSGLYFMIPMIISLAFYFTFAYLIDAIPKEMVKDYLVSLRDKWIS